MIVFLFLVLLVAFMQFVNHVTGSRTAGTLAGIAIVAIPLLIAGAAALAIAVAAGGSLLVLLAIPFLCFMGYRKIRAL
jgi:hypothetical protein